MIGNGDKPNLDEINEVDLLCLVYRWLQGVRAHPRMIEAVRRAALRLQDEPEDRRPPPIPASPPLIGPAHPVRT